MQHALTAHPVLTAPFLYC